MRGYRSSMSTTGIVRAEVGLLGLVRLHSAVDANDLSRDIAGSVTG